MLNIELLEEKYFLAIANTTKDMIHLNDAEGRIIYANPATEAILGYPLDELTNTPAFEIIHPDDHEMIRNDMAGLFSGSASGHLPSRDIRLRKKDGSYVDVEVRGFVVALAENTYIGAIIRDISRRKKTEKELESYRNDLEKLVEERTEKLTRAFEEIQTLREIIPICTLCKQIRDDRGYWRQVEIYLKEHAKIDLSHCICPKCAARYYPEFFPDKE